MQDRPNEAPCTCANVCPTHGISIITRALDSPPPLERRRATVEEVPDEDDDFATITSDFENISVSGSRSVFVHYDVQHFIAHCPRHGKYVSSTPFCSACPTTPSVPNSTAASSTLFATPSGTASTVGHGAPSTSAASTSGASTAGNTTASSTAPAGRLPPLPVNLRDTGLVEPHEMTEDDPMPRWLPGGLMGPFYFLWIGRDISQFGAQNVCGSFRHW